MRSPCFFSPSLFLYTRRLGRRPLCTRLSYQVPRYHQLTPVRLTLVLTFALAFTHLARTLQRQFTTTTADFFVALTLVQFHIPYYAGRTLPNFAALPLGEDRAAAYITQ